MGRLIGRMSGKEALRFLKGRVHSKTPGLYQPLLTPPGQERKTASLRERDLVQVFQQNRLRDIFREMRDMSLDTQRDLVLGELNWVNRRI